METSDCTWQHLMLPRPEIYIAAHVPELGIFMRRIYNRDITPSAQYGLLNLYKA